MGIVQGQALVASPYLTDPNFLRSVVYVLRHDEDGTIGLVLNRPMRATISQLLEQLNDLPIHNSDPVYYGGPVDGPLMLLQRDRSEDASGCTLCVISEQQRIVELCQRESSTGQQSSGYRLFDGYSGWGSSQLDGELKSGGWLVWDIQPEQLFSDPEELWHTAIRQIGHDILAKGIDLSKMPKDPAYN